jgi:predicted Zn-dependent protease
MTAGSMTDSAGSVSRLAAALEREAHRACLELKAPGHRRPYFVSYLLRDVVSHYFSARFGTLFAAEDRRWRRCFADVRLGSYRTDHVRDGGLHDNSREAESYSHSMLPIGQRLDGLLHGVWQLSEARYREAAEDWLDKRAELLHYRNEYAGLSAFERREPLVHRALTRVPRVHESHWTRFVERASAIGKREAGAYGCEVELHTRVTTRIFVSTEGAMVLDRQPLWQLTALLDYASEDGVAVPWTLSWFVTNLRELPSLPELKRAMREGFRRMRVIAQAPTLRAYSGPVLLDPRPAGLLMHEALGHRLEGSRLISPGEGQTFRGALGVQLLPDAVSMYDDPTLTHFEGRSLTGHFLVDDEGVLTKRADLVQRGSIRDYLSTRAGHGPRHHSNGHARNEGHERPISRMGVTVVQAENPVTDVELKAALLTEVKRRGLPFGIHVLSADSGETATKSYDFQAFLGQIRAANRVYLDGHEEPVRDVSFVGTPLNAVRGILAAGQRREVDNSYCGAESGFVPVSTISPALLVESLELQSSARSPRAPNAYSLPWS